MDSWKKMDLRGFEFTEKRIPAPRSTLIYKLSMMSVLSNISIGHLGLAAWLSSLPSLVYPLIS